MSQQLISQQEIANVPKVSMWDRVLSRLMPYIRLNAVQVDGKRVIKHRNPFGKRILPAANWFFRWSHAPIYFWEKPRQWVRWETNCFRLLHPQFHVRPDGPDGVCEDRLPGESLWMHLRKKSLTPEMLAAAGAEIRRAHGMVSYVHHGPWSHGDAAMCNVLYDAGAGRARLIDFEIIHDPALPAELRQADDLSVFLHDLAGFTSRRQWLTYALVFLNAYGKEEVIEALRPRLAVPEGRAKLWWKIRANFVSTEKLRRRLGRLDRALDHGAWRTAD